MVAKRDRVVVLVAVLAVLVVRERTKPSDARRMKGESAMRVRRDGRDREKSKNLGESKFSFSRTLERKR